MQPARKKAILAAGLGMMYGDVPFPKIKWIFQNLNKAEVLLTFNVDFLVINLANK
jgi:hypothetical protein